ncbi:MAG: hypothetical protein FJ095_07705 [Deltaproteobacteria bacterium]|nr:hypothetical protein [Deltaproteobacteria bacterium]
MTIGAILVLVALGLLVAVVAWRPHGAGPALGALAGLVVASLGGAIGPSDVLAALGAQWRAFLTLGSVMLMTTAAEHLGLLERLAARIEPRTRGPVRHAFRLTFALAALVATVFSNDAAVLLLTPTVLALLRTVYPRRHPKFLVPFAFAIFAAAGVAPLVVSNPMNLIVADHLGLGFNRYARVMIPVALASWASTYALLAWTFRDVLADDAPALGAWPNARPSLSRAGRVVLVTVVATLVAYPTMAALRLPLWPVAVVGGVGASVACLASGARPMTLVQGVAWPIFPFLVGVFVLALGLERIGVVAWLRELYARSDHPVATIGAVSALGSALLNNHPMSVLNVFALEARRASDVEAFAALVGGDLGPRLLPVGSLASLLWFDVLRKHDVEVRVATFVRVGLVLTLAPLAVSLAALAFVARLVP